MQILSSLFSLNSTCLSVPFLRTLRLEAQGGKAFSSVYAARALMYQRRRREEQCTEMKERFGKQYDMCARLLIKPNTARVLVRQLARGVCEEQSTILGSNRPQDKAAISHFLIILLLILLLLVHIPSLLPFSSSSLLSSLISFALPSFSCSSSSSTLPPPIPLPLPSRPRTLRLSSSRCTYT